MASIFLSYARQDRARAGKVASALEDAGHSVWWDRQIHAGSRFSAEIDRALKSSDLVVVLWSRASVDSAWVQDEAAAGRDSSRLVPVLIDPVDPPLGFRQYHAIDLKRGRATAYKALTEAVSDKLGAAEPTKPIAAASSRRVEWPILAIGSLILLALGAALFMTRAGQDKAFALAIVPASGASATSGDLAHQVALDFNRFRPSDLGGLLVQEGGSAAERTDYRAEIGLTHVGEKLVADLSVAIRDRSGLKWARTVEIPDSHVGDLRQQVAAGLSAALRCALWDPVGAKKLSNADFRLFLDGCTEITAETSDPDIRDLIPTLQRLVRNTPEFAPGQAMLALAAWNTATRSLDGQQGSLIATARSALAKAKQLRPDFEDVIAADSMITPASSAQWSHSFPILERGLRLHPDSALLLGLQSQRLMEVGRLGEASQSARQSMTHDPLSARARVNFIDALVYSGRINAAYAELRKFEAIWPNSGALADTRYRLDLRYGDPKSALAQLDRSGAEALTPVALDQSWIAFLQARIDPSPAKIEIALDAFRERYRRDPADIPGYIQALGTFGRADEAFEVTRNSETLDSLEASTDVLFRPHMRSLYADPRFMGLAYRLGLIAYWRETNVWPDFCREPQLPYDCAKEAAKYR